MAKDCLRVTIARSRRLIEEAVQLAAHAVGREQTPLMLAERYAAYAVVSAQRGQCWAASNDLRAARNKINAARQTMRRHARGIRDR